MSSWNIIICGDLPSTIVVCVPDPSKWTVSDLKQEVIKHVPKATANDITLYVGENEVPGGKPLNECSGLRNGTGLVVSIKPFIINVYCPDVDVTVSIEIPLLEFDSWIIDTVLRAIRFKLGDNLIKGKEILVLAGESLSNSARKISSIPDLSSHCLMTYTRFITHILTTPHNARNIDLPINVNKEFAQTRWFYNRDLSQKKGSGCWLSAWQIVVQQLDGSLITVVLPDPHKMSVIRLRETVEKVLSVPTHQQKLLLGDSRTVLEDWKSTAQGFSRKFIHDYPSFCDGIKLYFVKIAGIRVNVAVDCGDDSGYINIDNRDIWTLEKLATVMKIVVIKYAKLNIASVYICCLGKHSVSASPKPVSSVEWITNGCTLTLNNRPYL